jgi:hypothetical protein
MSRITILTKIALSTAFALAVAALTWATPGSAFVTTPLVRSTAATRINIKTHPNTLNDVQVQMLWPNLAGTAAGTRTLVPHRSRARRHGSNLLWRRPDVHAEPRRRGRSFTEEAGHVHFVRNEGTVAYEAYATFVVPVGVPVRTDECQVRVTARSSDGRATIAPRL